jgi:TP901 family phage tail tape measure protein
VSITAAELLVLIRADGASNVELALLAVGAAVVAAGVESVKMAGNFQQSITKLYTTAGEAKGNLQMVGDGILSMAAQVGTGAQTLVQAMYWIESGGAHGAAGLNDLRIAAEGAKAENSNLDDVAKALMGTLNAYKGTGLDAAHAMNILIASTANGMMTLQNLSGSIKNVLPAAAKFGISLIDVGAGLATMTSQGDNAYSAATHLRQVILALESPTKAGASALKEIGLTTQQVSDAMRKSLPGAIEMITTDLGKKFPEGSTAYNNAIKAIAGGNKQLLALLEVSGKSMQTYKDNVTKITAAVKAGGESVMGWSDIQKNFNFQLDAAGAAVESLMIKVGTALLPVLGQLFQAVTPTVVAFSDWIDKSGILSGITQTLSGWVGKLGEAFNYVADAFQQVFSRGSDLKDTFDRATSIIAPLAPLVGNLVDTFDRASGVFSNKLIPAMKPVLDTFDRATGIFNHTAGAVYGVDQAAQGAPNAWVPFWTFVKQVIADVARIDWGGIGAGLGRIAQSIKNMDWGKVGAFFSGLETAISKVDWGKVAKGFEDIVTWLTKVDWGKVGKAIADIAAGLVGTDWKKMGTDLKTITDALSKVDWGAVGSGISAAVQAVQWLVTSFQWAYKILLGGSIIPDIINGIVKWFGSLPGKLGGVITGTVNNIVNWFNQLPGRLGGIITTLIGSIVSWFASLPGRLSGIITGTVSSIGRWWGQLVGVISGIGGSILAALTSPFQSAVGTISGIIGNIGGMINNILGRIGSVAGAAAGIPAHASGTDFAPGGLSLVGEQGPELMYIPRGAQIIPNNKIGQMSSQGASAASGQPIQININIAGHRVGQVLLPEIVQAVRQATGAKF